MKNCFATRAALAAVMLLAACSSRPEALPPTPTTPYRPDPGRTYVWVSSSGSETVATATDTAATRVNDNERNEAAYRAPSVTHEPARPAVTPPPRPVPAPKPAPMPAPKKMIEEDSGPPKLDDPF